MEPATIVSRSTRVAARVVGGEAVIITPADGRILTLNETGTRLWELIEQPHTVAGLAAALAAEFAVSREDAERDVRQFVTELLRRGILEHRPAP